MQKIRNDKLGKSEISEKLKQKCSTAFLYLHIEIQLAKIISIRKHIIDILSANANSEMIVQVLFARMS